MIMLYSAPPLIGRAYAGYMKKSSRFITENNYGRTSVNVARFVSIATNNATYSTYSIVLHCQHHARALAAFGPNALQ